MLTNYEVQTHRTPSERITRKLHQAADGTGPHPFFVNKAEDNKYICIYQIN